LETISCIFCHSGPDHAQGPTAKPVEDPVVVEENGYAARRCGACGLIYVSPRPSLEEVHDLYGHDDAQVSAGDHISNAYGKRMYARHHLGLIRPFARGGTMLEIGAGAGFFLDEARKRGFDPYAIELNPVQGAFIRDVLNIPWEGEGLAESSFGGLLFDVIYHSDVVSHFFDPFADFTAMNRKLNDGGLMVFETGNVPEVSPRFLRYQGRYQLPDHLFFYTTENLHALLAATGFEVLKVYRFPIVLQQVAHRAMEGMLRRLGKGARGAKQDRVAVAATRVDTLAAAVPRETTPSLAGRLVRRLNYLLRYRLDWLLPKTGRPQTVVVVARKIRPA
jgi:2-polyprenyl-3-methyl-5-hydroxy-6-metoxy-1,4-benzoquinol methylase